MQGQSQVFDFEREQWTDPYPILAPREPRVSAHMFVQGNLVYRYFQLRYVVDYSKNLKFLNVFFSLLSFLLK